MTRDSRFEGEGGPASGGAGHPGEAARGAGPQEAAGEAAAGRTAGRPGTFAALAGVIDAATRMLRNEGALLRAEAQQALRETLRALVALVIAAVLGMVGLNVLAGAAVAGLTALGLSPFVAALVVGGVFVLLALGFAQTAKRRLNAETLALRRSGDSLRRNLDTVQTALRQDPDERA